MHPSHSAGSVQVRHASFRQFTALPLQSLAARPSNPPPIGVHLLLLFLFPFPVAPASLRLRNVTATAHRMQILYHCSTVVTLVGHRFFDAAQVDFRLFLG